jgi:hypothetical protein
MPKAGTYRDGMLGWRWDKVREYVPPRLPQAQRAVPQITPNVQTTPTTTPPEEQYTPERDLPTVPFEGITPEWNAMEKLTAIAPGLIGLGMPTYYDMLQQKHSPDIRLDRVSNAQELNDIQQSSALGTREMFANMTGKEAAINSAAVRANEIQNIMRSNANNNNINTQIANQEDMTNYQTDQQDQLFNLANIRQTFNNNVRAKQYRNEQVANSAIQSLNNANAIQRNLELMGQTMTASVLPYLQTVGITADGRTVDKNDPSAIYRKQVAPVGLGKNRMPFATGFGNIFGVPGNPSGGQDAVMALAEKFIQAGANPDTAFKTAAYTLGQMYKPNARGNSAYDEMMSNMMRAFLPNQGN